MKINLFQLASLLLLTIAAGCGQTPEIATKHVSPSDSLAINEERIALDFPYTETEIDRQLRKRIGSLTAEEKAEMERRNWLEYKIINGEKRYFSRAALNLQLLRDFHYNRAGRDSAEASLPEIIHRKSHTASIIRASETEAKPVLPVNMTISYTLTVLPDAVPPGETVRCWLPWPREDHPRQGNVKFISASPGDFLIAPDSAVHRTIYLEAKAEKGKPVVFNTSFSLEPRGQYFDPDKSYRLIISKGVAGSLWPEKTFIRSEPFDFQRGEVEWKWGNLYFDKWDYEMEIKYDK